MSEIRETTYVHSVSTQAAREPLFTVTDVLAGLWSATAFIAKGVAATANVISHECRSAKAAGGAEAAAAQLRPIAEEQLAAKVAAAGSAQDALKALASTPLFVMEADVAAMRAKVVALGRNGKAMSVTQVGELARDFARQHQQTLITNTVAIVREACAEIGFDRLRVRAEDGYVLAQRPDGVGGPSLRIDVKAGERGGIKLHLDADKFHGMACHEILGRLETALCNKGLRFDPMGVRPKQRRPVLDGLRAPLGTRVAFPRR